jgi:pyruvate dehydrogenase E1 component beta subunit
VLSPAGDFLASPNFGICDTTQFCVLFFLGDAFDYLDAPPIRVTGADVPLAYAKTLEQNSMPQIANVLKSVKKVLNK